MRALRLLPALSRKISAPPHSNCSSRGFPSPASAGQSVTLTATVTPTATLCLRPHRNPSTFQDGSDDLERQSRWIGTGKSDYTTSTLGPRNPQPDPPSTAATATYPTATAGITDGDRADRIRQCGPGYGTTSLGSELERESFTVTRGSGATPSGTVTSPAADILFHCVALRRHPTIVIPANSLSGRQRHFCPAGS